MGTSLLVISSMAAFAAFLTIFAALSTAMPMNDMYECCKEKTVGGTMYYKVDGMVDPKAYNCINGCVYVQESGPQKFCFAKGDLPVECNDGPGMSPKPPKPTDGGMSPKPPKPTDGGMPGMITTGEMPPFTDDGPFTDGGMPGMSPTGGMPGMSTMDEGMKPTEGAPVEERIEECGRRFMYDCEVSNCITECSPGVFQNLVDSDDKKTSWIIAGEEGSSCIMKCDDDFEFTTECKRDSAGNGPYWTEPKAVVDKCGLNESWG